MWHNKIKTILLANHCLPFPPHNQGVKDLSSPYFPSFTSHCYIHISHSCQHVFKEHQV